jgi:hypothetical protein
MQHIFVLMRGYVPKFWVSRIRTNRRWNLCRSKIDLWALPILPICWDVLMPILPIWKCFQFSQFVGMWGQQTKCWNIMINVKHIINIQCTKLSQSIFIVATFYMCMFNIRPLSSMFHWANQSFWYICAHLYSKILLWLLLLFSFWHGICAQFHWVWPLKIVSICSKFKHFSSF